MADEQSTIAEKIDRELEPRKVVAEQMPDFVIVTGMSGAGRTEAMHVFEDLGYFCVDNLPSSLLGDLVRVNEETESTDDRRRLAVVCDSRNGDFFGDLEAGEPIFSQSSVCMSLASQSWVWRTLTSFVGNGYK